MKPSAQWSRHIFSLSSFRSQFCTKYAESNLVIFIRSSFSTKEKSYSSELESSFSDWSDISTSEFSAFDEEFDEDWGLEHESESSIVFDFIVDWDTDTESESDHKLSSLETLAWSVSSELYDDELLLVH